MKTSPALRQWQTAHYLVRMFQNTIADLGVGVHPGRVAMYRSDLDKWTADRDRLHAALSPEDRAVADKIAKETT